MLPDIFCFIFWEVFFFFLREFMIWERCQTEGSGTCSPRCSHGSASVGPTLQYCLAGQGEPKHGTPPLLCLARYLCSGLEGISFCLRGAGGGLRNNQSTRVLKAISFCGGET